MDKSALSEIRRAALDLVAAIDRATSVHVVSQNAAPATGSRDLKSVADFAAGSPFTESQLRWWIHNAGENGLKRAGGITHIGRRVYIDANGFDRWLTQQNQGERK